MATKQPKIIAYKVFNPDWTCRGFQFAVGETYTHKGRIAACSSGFHACAKAADCFSYYRFDSENKVALVELSGATDTTEDDSKIAAEKIKIIRELNWREVLELVNTGKSNTGLKNSGDLNSGNLNSGDLNSGDLNSGDRNSGFFCTNTPKLHCFDKPTDLSIEEIWSLTPSLWNYSLNTWIAQSDMTDEEKTDNPHFETTGGYLKTLDYKESFQLGWSKDSDANKLKFFNFPNFDLAKFEEITGIDAKADFKRLVK